MKLVISLLLFGMISLGGMTQELNWISIEDLEEATGKDARKVLVYVSTSWCGWCKRMDKDTFSDAGLIDYLNQNFHLVKLDGEEKKSLLFKGFEFKFIANGRRGYNEMTKALLDGKLSYPSLVFLDEKLDRITIAPGYKDLKSAMSLLTYISEDLFKSQTWAEYQKGK